MSLALAGAAQCAAQVAGSLRVVFALQGIAVASAAASGGLSLQMPVLQANEYSCYAVNLSSGAVTQLLGLGFSKLIRTPSALYGLRNGTLYKMTGAIDPGNQPITATARFAQSDLGTPYQKRLHTVYLDMRCADGVVVTPIYDEQQGIGFYSIAYSQAAFITHKTPIGKGNDFNTLGLIVRNRNGGALDIGVINPDWQLLSRKPR
jgi:hypothetical protein